MGVDFFPCDECAETICDAGDWWSCEECGGRLCRHCARSHGLGGSSSEDGDDCPMCSGEVATDEGLLAFALEKLGVTREQLEAEYPAWREGREGSPS